MTIEINEFLKKAYEEWTHECPDSEQAGAYHSQKNEFQERWKHTEKILKRRQTEGLIYTIKTKPKATRIAY